MNYKKNNYHEKGYYRNNPCTESFVCRVCGETVSPDNAGTEHRNHCPNCLASLHVDIEKGDRESDCEGVMEPIAVWVKKNGEWSIIHRCRRCGKLSANRSAADDNPLKLMALSLKPLANPPFPTEYIKELSELLTGDPAQSE